MSSVIFLQGPLGPFFSHLARYISSKGIITHKINFNGGDEYYSWADITVQFKESGEHWYSFFHKYLCRFNVSAVFVYGDCRYYHKIAGQVCRQLDIPFWVFEEGYLRPDYITLEQGGVNAYSQLNWSAYKIDSFHYKAIKPAQSVGNHFGHRARYAMLYYFTMRLKRDQYSGYNHHRESHWVKEGSDWLRSFWRKFSYKFYDKSILALLQTHYDRQFYFFPLQTKVDFQLREHSDFNSVEHAISFVIDSFAGNCISSRLLVIKHHPMDRGGNHYGKFIKETALHFGVADRVIYVHDLPLPRLLRHAKGVVTVNSTVGISALLHRLPVKVLGRAIYDKEGLTFQGDLDNFWSAPSQLNMEFFEKFRCYLYENTQLEGCFYKNFRRVCQQVWKRAGLRVEPTER